MLAILKPVPGSLDKKGEEGSIFLSSRRCNLLPTLLINEPGPGCLRWNKFLRKSRVGNLFGLVNWGLKRTHGTHN
jgi:hypothetical protein